MWYWVEALGGTSLANRSDNLINTANFQIWYKHSHPTNTWYLIILIDSTKKSNLHGIAHVWTCPQIEWNLGFCVKKKQEPQQKNWKLLINVAGNNFYANTLKFNCFIICNNHFWLNFIQCTNVYTWNIAYNINFHIKLTYWCPIFYFFK